VAGDEVPAWTSRWRRAAKKCGPALLGWGAILAIRHDWWGLILSPLVGGALGLVVYLYYRRRLGNGPH